MNLLFLINLSIAGATLGSAEATAPVSALLAPPILPETLAVAPMLEDDAHDGSPFSYTYIEVGFAQYDVDDIDDEADIYYVEGSLALGMFHIIAGYQNTDLDFGDTDQDLLSLGAGLHFNLAPKFDLAGDISWLYSDVDSGISGLDDSESGYVIRVGPRWMPLEWDRGGLELNGEVQWIDLKNRIASEEEAFGWGVGARVHFIHFLSVGAEYSMLEDDDQIAGNVRFSF